MQSQPDNVARRSAAGSRRRDTANTAPAPPPQPLGEPDAFVGGFALAAPAPEMPRARVPGHPQLRREWSDTAPRPPSRTDSPASTVETVSEISSDATLVSRAPSAPSQVPSHIKRYSLVDRPAISPPPTAPTPPAVVIDEAPSVSGGSPAPQDSPSLSPPFLDSPPPDAPAVQNSLAALKKSDALERRASKRFSTYNISKMTGGSVRGTNPNRRSMAVSSALTPGDLAVLTEEGDDHPSPSKRERKPSLRSRSRNPSPIAEDEEETTPPVPPIPSRGPSPHSTHDVSKDLSARPSAAPSPTPEASSSSPRAFPVFLQLGREVKKVNIEPGLSVASLRVLFVDKFSYSPGQDNFPAIYIRDPSSGVQYELEDMDEVKEKCLLSLNIERE